MVQVSGSGRYARIQLERYRDTNARSQFARAGEESL
jgi:hypothetical protein